MAGSFFEDVYEVVRLVPVGRVTSYGAIARYLGTKNARMVGWAMNALAGRTDVPAHRVVNSQGVLSGAAAFETGTTMTERLMSENIPVKNNKIADFPKYFWDPEKELG